MKVALKHRIHRTIGIIIVPLLLISTATGVFRANQKWYWEEGYKKKKEPVDFSINKESISLNTLNQKIDSVSKKKNKFQAINIRPENGNLYFELVTKSKDKYLVDAYSGIIVSPISAQMASDFAVQYVKDKPAVRSCELIKEYIPRKGKDIKPAYKICFDNAVHSEIYLDYFTGEILEDIDDNRQFGLWVVKLHDYDFFGSKRSIASIVGIAILLLSFSGLWIYRLRKKASAKN